MEVLVAKIAALALMWFVTLTFGTVPILVDIFVRRYGTDKHKRYVTAVLGLLTFVAGGVFLGTITLDLIPDVVEEFVEAKVKTEFPLAYLVVAIGLLMFLVLEHFILFCLDRSVVGADSKSRHVVAVLEAHDGIHDESECGLLHHSHDEHSYGSFSPKTDEHEVPNEHDHNQDAEKSAEMKKQEVDFTLALRSYAIVVALSLHSVFDGMVVGFQKTDVSVWELFFTLLFHKILVAFSLGSKLHKLKHILSLKHIVGMVILFSTMSPLGGIISTALSETVTESHLTEAILVGFATGSFLYVTFFEMLKFDGTKLGNIINCLMVIIGFGIIALEQYITKSVIGK
ncbi:zinc transporter ZIP1-like [Tubulanus polymorphus]|uniref:zinc transporter ZIP1-like n=1 Tax=Tubulanus polymorphus TaxID=672921 RepID=UPI003DA64839